MRTRDQNDADLNRDRNGIMLRQINDQAYLANRDVQTTHDDMRRGTAVGDYAYMLAIKTAVGWEKLAKAIDKGLLDRLDDDGEMVSADSATEAFVDVADAERYAQRDDYVNAAPNLVGAMNRHSSNHGTAAACDPADPHDAALAEQARAEYVDYAEAEAVREIEREMAIEAGDDSEIDRQVAEDDARFERAVDEALDARGAESGS